MNFFRFQQFSTVYILSFKNFILALKGLFNAIYFAYFIFNNHQIQNFRPIFTIVSPPKYNIKILSIEPLSHM